MASTTYDLPPWLAPPLVPDLFASGQAGEPAEPTAWKRLRDLIRPSAAHRMEKDALQGRSIFLGSASRPYEAIAERRSALTALANHRGLAVTLTCRDASIAEDLSLLCRIDRDHALTVIWHLDAADTYRVQAVLASAAWFASHGLWTELRISGTSGAELSTLVRRAAAAGVGDVVPERGQPSVELERLRLVHGLPRSAPVRG